MDRVTYIVSGVVRTGTSMMMHCLKLGGMEVEYDKDLEIEMLEKFPNNKNKYYYELYTPGEREFDVERARGKCIKAMGVQCLTLGLEPLSVVYMRRDPLSQYESVRAALGVTQMQYQATADSHVRKLRDSVSNLVVFDYDDVLNEPLLAFDKLVANGWPIDPIAASKGVDKSMKHF